jgi:hypothetical protein
MIHHKTTGKRWMKFSVKLVIGYLELFYIDINIYRNFYKLSLFNFTIKNR